MQRSIVLLATVAVIGLGCSAAWADMMDLQVIGDVGEGDSWFQKFAVRAGEWETFNKLTFEITTYTFELKEPAPSTKGPSLGSFSDLATEQANLNNIISDTPDTRWVLNSETSTKAVASSSTSSIGGEFNWLEFTAKFNGDAPSKDNKLKLGFYIQLDLSDGSGYWWRSGNFSKPETDADALQISEQDGGFTPVPAPAAIGLGLLGLALVGWLKRRVA